MGKLEWETSKNTFSGGSLENGEYKEPGTAPKPIWALWVLDVIHVYFKKEWEKKI